MPGSDRGRHQETDCSEIFAALSDYLDGDLEEALCERLESHMDCCAPCREFLESLRRTVSWLSEQPVPELAPETRERICAAYRRRCGREGEGPAGPDAGDAR